MYRSLRGSNGKGVQKGMKGNEATRQRPKTNTGIGLAMSSRGSESRATIWFNGSYREAPPGPQSLECLVWFGTNFRGNVDRSRKGTCSTVATVCISAWLLKLLSWGQAESLLLFLPRIRMLTYFNGSAVNTPASAKRWTSWSWVLGTRHWRAWGLPLHALQGIQASASAWL